MIVVESNLLFKQIFKQMITFLWQYLQIIYVEYFIIVILPLLVILY